MARLSENQIIGIAAVIGAYVIFATDWLFGSPKKDVDPAAPALIDAKKGSSLRVGDKGSAVQAWQRKICAWASSSQPGLVETFGWDDGKYSEDVKAWTQYFQAQNGLTDDGIVGPQTALKMDNALRSNGLDPKKIATSKEVCG